MFTIVFSLCYSIPQGHEIHNEQMQGQVLNNIGNAYLAKGDYENARTYFERALQVREKLKVPSDIADTLHNLAETAVRYRAV
jgi:tetratricopeptide (TPR) repeat protein